MHSQKITESSPCLTISNAFLVWKAKQGDLQTNFLPSYLKVLYLLSSDNMIFLQKSIGLLIYSLINSNLFSLFRSFIMLFSLEISNKFKHHAFRTLWTQNWTLEAEATSLTKEIGLTNGFFIIYLWFFT